LTEFLLSLWCSVAVWVAFRSLGGRDPAVVERLAGLMSSPHAQSGRQSTAAGLVGSLGGRFIGNRHEAIAQALKGAGIPARRVSYFRGLELVSAASGALVGMLASSLMVGVVLAAVGYRIPILYLAKRSRNRSQEIAEALPDVIDLLTVCTQAGLNIALSLQRASGRVAGALGVELRRMLEEVDLGVPRPQALRALADRNQVEDLQALVGVLVNAERFGTQVAEALEDFARESRGRRRRRAEEQARRAPVKILFPLVFLILPAFILLTVVPLLLGTFSSLEF
jgi:tight adherence protein C